MDNQQIKKNIFATKNLIHLLVGITGNLLGLLLSHTLHFPVRLNCLGTMYAACMLGPIGGILTAAIAMFLAMFTRKIFLLYIVPSIAIGIICGSFYTRKNHEIVELVNCAFILCVTSTLLTTPLNLIFRRGYTGNLWGDALFDMMMQHHSPFIINSFMAELLVDFPDMFLSIFLTGGYLYLIKRYIAQPPTTDKEI